MKKIAVRNIRLCTKDCLCLYVCPTGAADTENSIIDVNKCIGCGVCAQSCPSGAISMVPTEYPPQQPKEKNVADALYALLKSKTVQERIARQLAENGDSPVLKQLAEAIAKSNRLMAEDILPGKPAICCHRAAIPTACCSRFLITLLGRSSRRKLPKGCLNCCLITTGRNRRKRKKK